jgi:hypothetical protein
VDQPDITHPFANFLISFGAARKLLERAQERGSLIEGMVVYVSLIDGLLRMSLVLDKQLAGNFTGDIDDYIQQVTAGPKFTEKMIYTEARQRNLIDDALRDEIIDLYNKRNAVIHRFFLEGMTYTSLEPLLDRYEIAYHRCYDVVNDLEERQIARGGPGMTHVGKGKISDQRGDIQRRVTMKLGFDPGF